ncbi:hypothetical protein ACWEQL_01055 [Kitasatospora sp. NPDC004240]
MTILLTDAGPAPADALLTRIGGRPLAPAGTGWPTCATCGGPLQFLAQIVLDPAGAEGSGVLSLFACQIDPGRCHDWSATSGANRALLFPAEGLEPIPLPALDEDTEEEVLVRSTVHALAPHTEDGDDHDAARAAWAERTGLPTRQVLGGLGGAPAWLQDDETPTCPACATPMPLAAQLQEGPDPTGAMNFGSGRGYAFTCRPCTRAAFLWQC